MRQLLEWSNGSLRRLELKGLKPSWSTISGRDLRIAQDRGELGSSGLVDSCEAVYAWRRSVDFPDPVSADASDFVETVKKYTLRPYGAIRDNRPCHFIKFGSISLSPAEWSADKLANLTKFCAASKRRRWLVEYIKQVESIAPPLYVGETRNLLQRTREHMTAETGFGAMVAADEHWSWDDLSLHYIALGQSVAGDEESDRGRPVRQLLETIATDLGVAGFVRRRG